MKSENILNSFMQSLKNLGATDLSDKIQNEMNEVNNITSNPHSIIDIRTIINITNNAWRAKTKMLDSESNEPKEEMKRVYRHIEAIIESLKEIGIEIIDQKGAVYDPGMSLNVISSEPMAGITKEEIKETIKPTIRFHNHQIQMGDVIVGVPIIINDNSGRGI